MAAGMPQSRKCIVLGVEINNPSTVAINDLERCFYAVCMSLDFIAEVFQEVTDGIMALVLLVCQLRVLMYLYPCPN
jgi:hypothetical protein